MNGTINPDARFGPRFRLVNPTTGEFLHMSGQGATKGTTYAWSGTRRQAETISRIGGDDWPYRPVPLEQVTGETT